MVLKALAAMKLPPGEPLGVCGMPSAVLCCVMRRYSAECCAVLMLVLRYIAVCSAVLMLVLCYIAECSGLLCRYFSACICYPYAQCSAGMPGAGCIVSG